MKLEDLATEFHKHDEFPKDVDGRNEWRNKYARFIEMAYYHAEENGIAKEKLDKTVLSITDKFIYVMSKKEEI
ncbi:hypothetical protein JCM19037_1590 [Geomicrobium sp. JCM 19037]|uniref:hypothetical protein n=1 Tax=Geomicrobium sp. JCM 19037 TaxID=1460634 RepID=UPI00045F3525|nr:hypothetical protein [Geomicrobium sp. JCM 19037]GAK03278.1 hypothetical protein JCM19037_1590 [Geomicrobium sp. JCM 19037]